MSQISSLWCTHSEVFSEGFIYAASLHSTKALLDRNTQQVDSEKAAQNSAAAEFGGRKGKAQQAAGVYEPGEI